MEGSLDHWICENVLPSENSEPAEDSSENVVVFFQTPLHLPRGGAAPHGYEGLSALDTTGMWENSWVTSDFRKELQSSFELESHWIIPVVLDLQIHSTAIGISK